MDGLRIQQEWKEGDPGVVRRACGIQGDRVWDGEKETGCRHLEGESASLIRGSDGAGGQYFSLLWVDLYA